MDLLTLLSFNLQGVSEHVHVHVAVRIFVVCVAYASG